MTIEFRAWPKIPRLKKPVVITEKIDGTNGAILIEDVTGRTWDVPDTAKVFPIHHGPEVSDIQYFAVAAQSRKRLITPKEDNHGFAKWVWDNASALALTLGPGHHFGEWWGNGVNRGYDLPKDDKRFSLFNVKRWNDVEVSQAPEGLGVVPVIATLPVFDTSAIHFYAELLRQKGSFAAPGFMNPEGVVVYHKAGNLLFKMTLDELP